MKLISKHIKNFESKERRKRNKSYVFKSKLTYILILMCLNIILFAGEENKVLPLKNFIESTFPGSLLKDEHQCYVHYQLKTEEKWSKLFGIMERAKEQYNVEDYSISQTTLEQVFLNFTRAQREVDDN